ncbi:MAG TPA: M56 family metallopeptidase [Vicinamibacterales bacterium]|nr:M56 family metallopeptidase [Vicinamibacterales bacterium]
MRYWILASTVTLSSFAIGLAIASAIGAALVPFAVHRLARRSSGNRASLLLWLRLFPVAGALAFSAALVLPTFVYYEPANTDEPLTATMAAIAAAGLIVILRAGLRIAQTWRATERLARRWKSSGHRLDDMAPGLSAFAVDEAFPTVAVVGCFRPALFLSRRVLAECTSSEISAMVSHERAHIASRDNLKRLLVRACPRLPFSEMLESAWSGAAEEAADAAAAAGNTDRRLNLANALIRLARLASPPSLPAGVSAFYPGGSIENRVRLLLDPPASPAPARGSLLVVALAAVAGVAFVASAPAIHAAMEALVRLVP